MRFERIMRMNPELGRNLLLDIKTGKMVFFPMILAGIYYLVYLMDSNMSYRSSNNFAEIVLGVSITIFFMFAGLLASGSVSMSMIDEKNSGTWDLQRMNATGPMSMTIGKFVGGGAFGWYVALIAYIAYWCSLIFGSWSDQNISRYLFFGLTMPLVAIMAQGVALLSAIIMVQQSKRESKTHIVGSFALSAWLCITLASTAFNIRELDDLAWFALKVNAEGFLMFTLFVYSAWILVGAYRLMRQELQMKNGPRVWLAFELFTVIFISGLAFESVGRVGAVASSATVGFFVSLGFTYLTAASDSSNIVDYERVISAFRQRDYKRFSVGMPLWVLSLMVTAVAFVVSISTVLATMGEGKIVDIVFIVSGVFGLLLRDMLILLSVRTSGKIRRPGVMALLMFIVLYGLLPAILGVGGSQEVMSVLLPLTEKTSLISVIVIGAQVIAALIFFRSIWRKEQARMDLS